MAVPNTNFEISSHELVLQRSPSVLDGSLSVINSTFTLQDHVEIMHHSSEEFHEAVKQEMREKGIGRDQAMDSVRVQRLIQVCDTKESTVLYLLEEWNYEPQVYRFIQLLCDGGVDLAALGDFLHNNPLHIAAKKNYVTLAQFLVTNYPSMLLATNSQGELPVETAIGYGQDEVAAFLIRQMDHRRALRLFKANQQRKAAISLMKITEEFKLQKTIVAVLDCLISPRWPHPPCLPFDSVPCLSWQNFQDTPTHFYVTYDILESDVKGRCPDESEYEYTPKSCYYNLAKHLQRTLNKDILNHAVIQTLTARKWQKYALFWFRVRALNYILFLSAFCSSMIFAARSRDPLDYGASKGRLVPDFWSILVTLWFLADECSELRREPKEYMLDIFNYLDLSGYSLILITYVFRYLQSDQQWTFGSLAVLVNFIGIFKYSIGSRETGLYIKCLGKVIYKDIPRFLSVFVIILLTFSLSFFLAIKGYESKLKFSPLRNDINCTTEIGCVVMAGVMTWLEGSAIVSSLNDVGFLAALLIIIFMISVSVILLNILIAQLSLTYEMVQEESLLSFTALRMQAVATIEWQSRFKYWNCRKKYYIPGELKTKEEMGDLMSVSREQSDVKHSFYNQIKRVQQRVIDKMRANVNQRKR
ncbi:transient receptor potential cation channel subfamily A member 1-like [Montipora capricornis]|uniref:transient receptor potential cation channel subfamily A member 1-like n=1 Tax=Montipora capricornis TaxID=246305 RepID=UPI0035F0FC72